MTRTGLNDDAEVEEEVEIDRRAPRSSWSKRASTHAVSSRSATPCFMRSGVWRRQMVGVLVAAAPMLSGGLVLLASSAVRLDWSTLALGVWLLAVAAGGTWAGPVTILAVYALAGGGGFLAIVLVKALPRHT
jgi:hypothetical protein